jgi:hypothetical protein
LELDCGGTDTWFSVFDYQEIVDRIRSIHDGQRYLVFHNTRLGDANSSDSFSIYKCVGYL